jgi:hypothetical protein
MTEEDYPQVPEDKRISWSIHQLQHGELRYEIKIKGDTIEEVRSLMEESKKELDKVCKS